MELEYNCCVYLNAKPAVKCDGLAFFEIENQEFYHHKLTEQGSPACEWMVAETKFPFCQVSST